MSLRISRILHAGYVFDHGFESNLTTIAFDPVFENPFSRNCYPYPNVEFDKSKIRELRFDAVFISHFHDDHLSLESLDLLSRETPIYLYCLFPEFFKMLSEMGFKNVHSLHLDQTVQVGSIAITARRALDIDVDSLFEIEAGGLKVLNVVDSWIDDETLDRLSVGRPWDMVLWPFQTMREIEVLAPTRKQVGAIEAGTMPREWESQLRKLNPRFVVPSSCQFIHEAWSWYNAALFPMTYRKFEQDVQVLLPTSKVVRLNPSVSIRLSKEGIAADKPLDWVLPIGPQDVDYEYEPDLMPTSMAEIATHFRFQNDAERKQVERFCEFDLPARFRELPPIEEPYFEKPRGWRLRIYDGAGEVRDYRFKLFRGEMSFDPEETVALGWMTEIPGPKISAALHDGESLTSLYLRINATKFDDEVEAELMDVDLVQDPLIRCLYTGEIGRYQAAQLKRILKRGGKI